MSSSKVSSGAPVGHTTSVMKLNGVRAASPSSVAASISSINDSTNIGSSTDQYLLSGDDGFQNLPTPEVEENASSVPFTALEGEVSAKLKLQFQEGALDLISAREAEKHVETYERTLEQSEQPLKKKTQGFG